MSKRTVSGWPVIEHATYTGPLPRLRKWNLPGTGRHLILRDGAAGFLLAHFALWWHERVSRLDGGIWDEWGWAVRPVRGQTTGYSNHAGGVAADLDATEFPYGAAIARVFKPLQIRRIRRRLKLYREGEDYVLGWGGDYRSTPDGMHVELAPGSTLAQAERVARRLMKTKRGRRILDANPGARQVIES